MANLRPRNRKAEDLFGVKLYFADDYHNVSDFDILDMHFLCVDMSLFFKCHDMSIIVLVDTTTKSRLWKGLQVTGLSHQPHGCHFSSDCDMKFL